MGEPATVLIPILLGVVEEAWSCQMKMACLTMGVVVEERSLVFYLVELGVALNYHLKQEALMY